MDSAYMPSTSTGIATVANLKQVKHTHIAANTIVIPVRPVWVFHADEF